MDTQHGSVHVMLRHADALANATYELTFTRGRISGGFAHFITMLQGNPARFLLLGEIASIQVCFVLDIFLLTPFLLQHHAMLLKIPDDPSMDMLVLWYNQIATLNEITLLDERRDASRGLVSHSSVPSLRH
jgi:hypothetical protein